MFNMIKLIELLEDKQPEPLQFPDGFKPAKKVPEGGAMCANCAKWNKETQEYKEIEEELIEEIIEEINEEQDVEEELEEQESDALKIKEPIIKKRKDVNEVDDEEG